MKRYELKDVLPIIKGKVIKGNLTSSFNKVTTRTKHLGADSIFFCINKKKLTTLKDKLFPPCIVVIDNLEMIKQIKGDVTIVKVNQTKKAFRRFLLYYRSLFDFPVIAITGSTGKTTTKQMITHILKEKYNVKSTLLNYNLFQSNVSVLMKFDEKTDFGVFEFGVGYRGHLSLCSKHMGPFSAVITTIGADHISRYRSKEDYIQEKAKVLKGLGQDNVVILNEDCENIKKIDLTNIKNKIYTFGFSESANYQASNFLYENNGIKFTLKNAGDFFTVYVPGFGKHNVYNALAAITTTHIHGIPIEESIERLKTFRQLRRHLEIFKNKSGLTIIDDTWNTNSTSVEAALSVLKDISAGKETIAILGQISELGAEEESEHKKIGKLVYDKKIGKLITIGETASIISNEAIKSGMNDENVFSCFHESGVMATVQKLATPNSIILVKTSMRQSFKNLVKNLKQL